MRKNKVHRYFFSCLSAGVSLQCRWQDAQFPPQPPCQPPFWQINPIASASSTKITMTTITLAIPIASAYYYTTKRCSRQVYILHAAAHTTRSRKEATIWKISVLPAMCAAAHITRAAASAIWSRSTLPSIASIAARPSPTRISATATRKSNPAQLQDKTGRHPFSGRCPVFCCKGKSSGTLPDLL